MQNHTVVPFPLESYRAIKKQFEAEIDVPWGLLPGMRRISKPPGPRGISLAALLPRRPRSPTRSSSAGRCHRSTGRPWHLSNSAKGKRSPGHPAAPRRTHRRTQGRRQPAVMASCLICCGFFSIFFHQVLWHIVTSWMWNIKELNPQALQTDSDNKHGLFSTGSTSYTRNPTRVITR